MRFCFRFTRALRALVSRLLILVLLLASTVVYAGPSESNPGASGGVVSYWLLAFLLAVNIAGVIHMRRWAATTKSREDKE